MDGVFNSSKCNTCIPGPFTMCWLQGHFSTPLFSSIDEIEYREWLYMVIATSWKVSHNYIKLMQVWYSSVFRTFTCRRSNFLGRYNSRHIHLSRNNRSGSILVQFVPRIQSPSRKNGIELSSWRRGNGIRNWTPSKHGETWRGTSGFSHSEVRWWFFLWWGGRNWEMIGHNCWWVGGFRSIMGRCIWAWHLFFSSRKCWYA